MGSREGKRSLLSPAQYGKDGVKGVESHCSEQRAAKFYEQLGGGMHMAERSRGGSGCLELLA